LKSYNERMNFMRPSFKSNSRNFMPQKKPIFVKSIIIKDLITFWDGFKHFYFKPFDTKNC